MPEGITFDDRTVNGIYLSYWSDPLQDYDFGKLSQHINYAILHSGWQTTKDVTIDYHVQKCLEYGIPYGLNLYIRHWKPWRDQYKFFVKQWDTYDPPLGIYANFEGGDHDMTKAQMQDAWTKFANNVDDDIGEDAWGVYTRAEWWNRMFPRMDWPKRHRLWVAHYQNNWIEPNLQTPTIPDDWGAINNPKTWTFWQYSDENNLAFQYGAGEDADDDVCLDCFNGHADEFERLFGVPVHDTDDSPPPSESETYIVDPEKAYALYGRSEPNSNDPDNRVIALYAGQEVTKVGESGNWFQVDVDKTVWMHKYYLKQVE